MCQARQWGPQRNPGNACFFRVSHALRDAVLRASQGRGLGGLAAAGLFVLLQPPPAQAAPRRCAGGRVPSPARRWGWAGRRFRRHCLGWRGRLRHCGRWRGRRRRLRHCSQWHCSRWRGRRLGRSVAGARALRRRCRPVKVVGSWASRRSTWNQRWMLCGSSLKRAMGRSGALAVARWL